MQSNCPYQLIEQLGSTDVGSVWSAVDERGAPLTVALLDAQAAADRRWRDPFVAAVTTLAQSREAGHRVVSTGLTGPSPWIALAATGGQGAELVFQSLGVQYVPARRDGNPWGSAPNLTPQWPQAGPDQPVQPAQPAQPDPFAPMPGSPWAPRPSDPAQQVPIQQVPFQQVPAPQEQPPAPQPPTPEYGATGWLAEAASSIQWPLGPATKPFEPLPPDEPTSVVPAPTSPEPTSPAPTSPGPMPPAPTSSAPVSPGPMPPGPMPPAPAFPAPTFPPPTSSAPVSPGPMPPLPMSPGPVSPGPVSGPPVSVPPMSAIETAPLPWAWGNQDAVPQQNQSPFAPPAAYPPLYGDAPARTRSRTRLWIVLSVVIVVVVAGGAVLGWQLAGGSGKPQAGPSPSVSALPVPTPTPLRPGLEPPLPGAWPQWPKFGAGDKVTTRTLDGIGFAVTLPATWTCARAASATGYVKYNCGTTVSGDQMGGELIVRDCAAPCDAQQQATMRATEEAWGLQWRQAGQNVSLAETTKLNGAARYGLVIVAYRHSTTGGALDKQVVLRLTSPVSWLDDLRKIANATRDSAAF